MQTATLKIDIWTRDGELAADNSGLPELFAPHAAHVQGLLEQGYMSGEIVDDRFSGWWTIEST